MFSCGFDPTRHISWVNNPLARYPPFSALRGSRRPFSVLKRGSDSSALSLSLSLTLAFRHFDILWHNVENRGTQGSFSYYFFNPNDLQRLSPCRERVVYPPLVAVCRGQGGTPALHSVFFSLYAFCLHAESFSFSLPSFSHQARVLRISRNAER